MRLLVLGGTRFLGRHLVEHARAQGHDVTLFHRGRTGTELFPGVRRLVGDRTADGDPAGLAALAAGTYGPLKAACERAAEAACPGRATAVRSGLVIGPDGVFLLSCARALAAGYRPRPFEETARDTIEWIRRARPRFTSPH